MSGRGGPHGGGNLIPWFRPDAEIYTNSAPDRGANDTLSGDANAIADDDARLDALLADASAGGSLSQEGAALLDQLSQEEEQSSSAHSVDIDALHASVLQPALRIPPALPPAITPPAPPKRKRDGADESPLEREYREMVERAFRYSVEADRLLASSEDAPSAGHLSMDFEAPREEATGPAGGTLYDWKIHGRTGEKRRRADVPTPAWGAYAEESPLEREYRLMVERAYRQFEQSEWNQQSNPAGTSTTTTTTTSTRIGDSSLPQDVLEHLPDSEKPSEKDVEASYPEWGPHGTRRTHARTRRLTSFFRDSAPHIWRGSVSPLAETFEIAVPVRDGLSSSGWFLRARMAVTREVADRVESTGQWGGRSVHAMGYTVPGYNHRVVFISASRFRTMLGEILIFLRNYPFPSGHPKWGLFLDEYFSRGGK